MPNEIRKVSFFMVAFVLIMYALLPLLSMIESGFESTAYYYENYE